MGRAWSGDGPAFAIEWGGRTWTLRTDADRPGLYLGDRGPILGLAGLAARHRCDVHALGGRALARSERHYGRIEATYRPSDWGEMTVRAAWSPMGDDAIDLEVEVSARSVGELGAVEVLTVSVPGREEGAGRYVSARDRHCAGLSYDGRENELATLQTLRIRAPGEVWPCFHSYREDALSEGGRLLLLMGRPEDVSRQIVDLGGPTVFALFGHDLERGVVLRGRLRALWVDSPSGAVEPEGPAEFRRAFEAFCAEPPPLTT